MVAEYTVLTSIKQKCMGQMGARKFSFLWCQSLFTQGYIIKITDNKNVRSYLRLMVHQRSLSQQEALVTSSLIQSSMEAKTSLIFSFASGNVRYYKSHVI